MQKRSEDLYNMSNEYQKQKFFNEVDQLLKTQGLESGVQGQGTKGGNKGDILILNTNALDYNNWYQQNQQQNVSYSLNHSSLFNDSRLLPYEQNMVLNTQQFGGDGESQIGALKNQNFLPQNNLAISKPASGISALPSNSIQLSLDQFTKANPHISLPSQNLLGTQYIPSSSSDNNQQQQQPPQVSQPLVHQQLIQQYEQVLQLMHQEIQKLMLHNQQLIENQNGLITNRSTNQQNDNNFQQIQMLIREKEDFIETLRQREHVIMQLRLEIDQLNGQLIELQSRLESQNTQTQYKQSSEAMVKAKNEHMMERLKKLEKQVREMEQQNFELEQMNKNLKRDLKHQTIINEQLQQEQVELNQKRDALDQMVQEAKNKICQQMLQMRQLSSQIDNQSLEIVNVTNQKFQYEKLAEQTNLECEQLRDQLNESEGIKLGQFQIIERKDREIQNLRVMLRRFLTVIQTHREEFGDLADVNYDNLFKDVSNTNLNFQLPQSQFQHLSKINKQVKFDVEFNQPLLKHKPWNENNSARAAADDDYYGMVEKLAQYVRDQQSPQSYRQRSPPRTQPQYDFQNQQPKSILKNSIIEEGPIEQPTTQGISWLSGPAQNPPQQQQQKPQRNNSPPKGGNGEKKPNIEGLKQTLSTLIQEKKSLETQLRTGHSTKMTDDLKFELEVNGNNIKRIQEKLQAAGAL